MIRRVVFLAFFLLSFAMTLFVGPSALAQDADDDGIPDADEVYSAVTNGGRKITHPYYSRSPVVQRSVLMDGTNSLALPENTNRFSLTTWTVECWAKPAVTGQTVAVLERSLLSGSETTFRLELVDGVPAVSFMTDGRTYRAGGQLNDPIPTGAWTHVAGVLDNANDRLSLYVNGEAEQSLWVWEDCPTGPGLTTMGVGYRGRLDDVRVWDNPRGPAQIDDARWRFGEGALYADGQGGSDEGLVAYYPFDDGGNLFEDFIHLTNWSYAVTNDAAADDQDYVDLVGWLDDDGDDIPDWWEAMFVTDGDADPAGNLDADPLNNLYEYYADTNPKFGDSDGDGVPDDHEDYDNDGVLNGDEQDGGADPRLPDTDDDGISDADERAAGTDMADALVPLTWRALDCPGDTAAFVELPRSSRFALDEWTLEAWVRPAATNAGGIVSRRVAPGVTNFVLRMLADGRVSAGFGAESVASPFGLATDGSRWAHVAATFEGATRQLTLYIDGEPVAVHTTASQPRASGAGPIEQRIGAGFEGPIDDVRIWGAARSRQQIHDTRFASLAGDESDLVAYYRFDDGSSFVAGTTGTSRVTGWTEGQVQDDAAAFAGNWLNLWRAAGSVRGGIGLVALAAGDNPTTEDTDGDLIPDAWETRHGLDPNSSTGPDGASGDPDGDRLNNYYEYLADRVDPFGCDPRNPDTDGDSRSDYDEDSDGDTLSNGAEQDLYATDPGNVDTDDDTFRDGDEVNAAVRCGDRDITGPLYSRSPLIQRSMVLDGSGHAITDPAERGQDQRFDLPSWRLSCYLMPSNTVQTGAIIERVTGLGQTNFSLRIESGVPVAAFTSTGGMEFRVGGNAALPSNGWSLLEAEFSPASDVLSLSVNGVSVQSQVVLASCATGWASVVVGDGLAGRLDQLEVDSADGTGSGAGVPFGAYAFDDGGVLAEDFEQPLDWDYAIAGVTFSTNVYVPDYDVPDADDDGLPDWWEALFFAGDADPDADPDDDGLTNLFEFHCDTNPHAADTDNDGRADADEDSDADGVFNGVEQERGSHPLIPDTDDDGVSDGEEQVAGTDPTDSLDPFEWRAVSLPGAAGDYVEMPAHERFKLPAWTIEAWVRPAASWSTAGRILAREVEPGIANFLLALDAAGRVVGGYGNSFVTSSVPVTLDGATWTHVAASCDGDQRITIVIDGTNVASGVGDDAPRATGAGPEDHALGRGFGGEIAEVRLWNSAIGAAQLAARMDSLLIGNESGLVSWVRFDDGTAYVPGVTGTSMKPTWDTGQVQDFVQSVANDWLTAWANAATLRGAATVTNLALNDVPLDGDSDGDGMPDGWEIAHGLDPNDPSDADDDPDGDGLTNLYEYYCGTDPRNTDSDGDLLPDDQEDAENDGLVNIDEQTAETDPRLPDTDDDGLDDVVEVSNGSSPTNSLDPFGWSALALPGGVGDYVVLPDDSRLALQEWTLEAWVQPRATAAGGTIVRRDVAPGDSNYMLALDGGMRPFVTFGTVTLNGVTPIPSDGSTWTHVAATYDATTRRLRLFVNGDQVATRLSAVGPNTSGAGPVVQRVGESFDGRMDEVRVWDRARSETDIADGAPYGLQGNETGLVLYYRFDDGTAYVPGTLGTSGEPTWATGQVQDFASGFERDWLAMWANAGTLVGGATLVPLTWSEIPLDDDADGDGMPDSWEILHGLDPSDPSDATDDPDGDGLINLYEYYCSTDPNNSNTDGDLLPDGLEDFDTDGAENILEQDYGSDPRLGDTDDDGVADVTEIASGYDPANSLVPLAWRALSFTGAPSCMVTLPSQDRFALSNWTVEAWVRPDAGWSGAGTVLSRTTSGGATNYLLAIDAASRPRAGFVNTTVSGVDPIVTDGTTWTHLATTYDAASQRLRLYVNGVQVASRLSVLLPPATADAGAAVQVGAGFAGLVDELRVWRVVRSAAEIADGSENVLAGDETGLVGYYRTDDGTAYEAGVTGTSLQPTWQTGQVQDFREDAGADWLQGWGDAGTLTGGTVFVDLALSDVPINDDSDGDGMPDLWEILHGLDPTDPTDAFEDPDGDGLVNLYEYYCSTDPNNSNTDGDLLTDDQEDFDNDGLVNVAEQGELSDPRLPDTDDDGVGDLAEVEGGYDPTASLVPLAWRALALPGGAGDYASFPTDDRFALSDWTLEAWVLPSNTWAQAGTVMVREPQAGITNYVLTVDASLRPRAGFGDQMVTASAVLPGDGETWSHLAVTFNASDRVLTLYVNGADVGSRTCAALPVTGGTGPLVQQIGAGFAGLIDEVRFWDTARSASEIATAAGNVLSGSETGLVAYYRFDDGTSYVPGTSGTSLVPSWNAGQIQEFADGFAFDWLDEWDSAATLHGGATLYELGWTDPVIGEDTDGDGMPDAWELEHGLDPFDPTDADEDPDDDGLTNLYEYYSDTDPNDRDSDDDGEWDRFEDRDGDGLENMDEQTHGSDPRLPDTDDDGLSDLEENVNAYDPASSLVPLRWRALDLPGTDTDYVTMPDDEQFQLTDWTVEAWIQPSDLWLGGGVVVHRDVEPGETNFFLGIDDTLAPVAGFGENTVTSDTAIAADNSTWTHIAATYMSSGQWLRVYVDGVETGSRICSANPRFVGLGPVVQRMGIGVDGLIDDVRIWRVARSAADLQTTMDILLTGEEDDLVAYYRFDDATSFERGTRGTSDVDTWTQGQVEDFVAGLERNWLRFWADAATLNGTALFTADGLGAPLLPPQSLRVTLDPDTVGTGAQWRVWLDDDWSEWQGTDAIVRELTPGIHTTEYAEVAGWVHPSNETVTITTTSAVTLVRYYAKLIGDDGSAKGEFRYPRGLAVYDDYLYVSDSANHRVQRLDTSTNEWLVLGGSGTAAGKFNQPFGLAVDDAGNLYVADSNNNRVQRRGAGGGWTTWGGAAPGTAVGEFNGPFDIAVDTNGNLYVADHYNDRIQKRASGGAWSVLIANGFDDDETRHPNGVEMTTDGNLIVADHDGINGVSRVRMFTTDGDFVKVLATSQADEGDVRRPMHMGTSFDGDLFCADSERDRVIVYTGTATRWIDVTASGFVNTPWSVALDDHDRMYVADTYNHRVLRLDLDTATILAVRKAEVSDTASTFKWVGKAGWRYTVEYRDNLHDGDWQVLPGYGDVRSDGGVMTCVDTAAPAQKQRFYRILAK